MSLQDAKLELEAYLGSNAPQYWTCLRNFLTARVSKIELDLVAREFLLDQKGLALHNAFLRTVLVNAATKDSASLPTSGERLIGFGEASGDYARPKEKRPQVRLTDELVRRLHKTREIMTIAKADRQNIKALVQRRKGSKNAAPPPPPPVNLPPPVLLFTPMQNPLRFPDNDSCWDTREIPGYAELRQRLLQKVDESGLKFVNDQVVYLLMFALEVHIKNVITNFIRRVRPLKGVGTVRLGTLDTNSGVRTMTPSEAIAQRKHKHVIRIEDLLLSLEMAPHILGENKFYLEKMSHQLYADES